MEKLKMKDLNARLDKLQDSLQQAFQILHVHHRWFEQMFKEKQEQEIRELKERGIINDDKAE